MSQVIIWHNGKYYERVRQDEDKTCEGCAGDTPYNEKLCAVLAGPSNYGGGASSPIRCSAPWGERGVAGSFSGSGVFAYRFEEIEVSDDKYRRATGA